MLNRVSILFLVVCNYFFARVETQQLVGIVHSVNNYDQCLRQVYLGNGPWIELADCSVSDQNQWVLVSDVQNLEEYYTSFQFYSQSPPPPTVALPPQPPMPLPPPPPNGMCLSLYDNDIINQYPVLSWDCCGQDNQMWLINGNYDTSFQLQLQFPRNCLTLDSDTKYARQATCLDPNNATGQTWVIESFDPRARQVQSQENPNMCLSYVGNSNDPYRLILVNCDSTDTSQIAYPLYDSTSGQPFSGIQFINSDVLIYAASADDSLIQENNFELQFFGNCLTIGVSGNSLGLQACASGMPNQAWTLVDLNPSITFNNAKVLLKHKSSGLCLQPASDESNYNLVSCDTTGIELMAPIDWENGNTLTPGYLQFSGNCLSVTQPNSKVTQLQCAGAMIQRWYILQSKDPSAIQLKNSNNNWCLTAEESLTYMYLSDCTNPELEFTVNQMWIIVDKTQ